MGFGVFGWGSARGVEVGLGLVGGEGRGGGRVYRARG